MTPEQAANPVKTPSQVEPSEAASPAPPAGPAAKAPETPAPGRDFVADSTVAAMQFAKRHPVGKGRTNLGQWLSSTFLKPGDEEEWSAGAVEGSVYLVSYRHFQGGKAAQQKPATYLFEVDLDNKTLQGRNPAARELLVGAAKAQSPAKPAKRAKKGPPPQEPAAPGAELSGE